MKLFQFVVCHIQNKGIKECNDKETFEKDIEEWGRTLYPNQDIKDYPTIKLLSRAMINYYLLNYL